jgi:O-antigen ligase
MSGRKGLWDAELSLFSARPILGYGYVASRGVLLTVLPWAGEAHNALGETALDLGFAGMLILWVPLMVSFLQSLLRDDPYHDDWTSAAVAAFLAFLLVDGISESGFTGVVSYLPVMFFATMFAHRDGWGRTVQERVDRSADYAVNRTEHRRRAWALQWPTGGAV